MKENRIESYYRSIIAISAVIDLAITIYFLSVGVNTVFQNIFYFTIVLAAYRYRWRGAYFSIILSASYLLIFAFFYPDLSNLTQASIRTIIFIIIGFVVAFLSNELLKEKMRYQTIFSASGSGMIVVIGNDRTIAESNSRFSELFGEGAAIKKRIDAYFDPKDLDKAIESIANGEKPHGTEMVMTLQTGEKKTCIVTIGRLNPDEFVLSINDITNRKRSEETLWMMAVRKDAILAAVPDIMVEVDDRKRFTWVNQPGLQFYGEDVIGQEASNYFEGEQKTYAKVQPLFDGDEEIIHLESWQRRRDGEKRLLSWRCKVLKDEQGRVTGALSSARDITESKRAEQEREVVHAIGEAIITNPSLDEILQVIHQNIKKVMYAENCYIALWDASTGMISFPFYVDQIDPKLAPRANHRGLTEYVLMTARPLLLTPEILKDLVREHEIEIIGTPPESWLGVPLFIQSNPIGVLVVQSYEPGNRYTDAEKDLLVVIGNQAALVIERGRAEEALRESVQRYELVMDGSSAGLWDWDVSNNRIHYSLRWKAMRGYTDDEISDSPTEWSSHIYPDDSQRVTAALKALLIGQAIVYEEEYRVFCKDGSIKWILDRGKAVCDATGHVIRMAGSEIDITERKLAEESLKQSEERIRSLLNSAAEGIYGVDIDGICTFCNPSCLRQLGYERPDELHGKNMHWLIHSKHGDGTPYPIEECLIVQAFKKGEGAHVDDEVFWRPDGTSFPVEYLSYPQFHNGVVSGAVMSFLDITERKHAEQALRQANAKLGILSTITRHDINNQIMVFNGFLELCKLREKDSELARYFDKMSRAVANVQEQIAFTKTYQELGVHAPAWASVSRRINEAFSMLNPPGIVLEDKTDGVEVLTDPMADKVQYNLVDNSLRHGGHVTRIKMSAEQIGDAMLIVYEDDGVGISAEDKKRLFQKGFGKNTGYGLFLIREILAITGITIMEKGQAGEGVRFEMLVPAGAWRRT